MKNNIILFLLGLAGLFFPGYSLSQISWTPIGNYPFGAVEQPMSFTIAGTVYAGGGRLDGTYPSNWYKYNPVADSWTPIDSFPGLGRWSPITFAVNGKGYCALGHNGSMYFNDVWEYDPIADSWTQKNNFSGPSRYSAISFVIGNKAYAGTGFDGSMLDDFYEYDPSLDTWTPKAPFPLYIQAANGFAIDSLGYLAFGLTISGAQNKIFAYSPTTDLWSLYDSIPDSARYASVSFVAGDSVFCGGGKQGSTYLNGFYNFKPSTNSWTALPMFPGVGRYAALGFYANGSGFVGAGSNGGGANPNELQDLYKLVLLSDTSEAIEDFSAGSIGIFPTISTGNFTVKNPEKISGKLEIIDLCGKTMISFPSIPDNFNFSHNAGLYIYKSFNDKGKTIGIGKLILVP